MWLQCGRCQSANSLGLTLYYEWAVSDLQGCYNSAVHMDLIKRGNVILFTARVEERLTAAASAKAAWSFTQDRKKVHGIKMMESASRFSRHFLVFVGSARGSLGASQSSSLLTHITDVQKKKEKRSSPLPVSGFPTQLRSFLILNYQNALCEKADN